MTVSIFQLIQTKLADLPESEAKIAHYILANPQQIISKNIGQLAVEAQSSPAAVVRFCYSIGVKGYTDLKLQLSAQIEDYEEMLYTDIGPKETIPQIKKKLLMNTSYIFEQTNDVLVDSKVDQVAQMIVDSSIIYVYGLGASQLVALDLKQKFTRLGKQVISSLDQHELVASMAIAPDKALYIGVSNSGEKGEGLVTMQMAMDMGIQTISITENTENSLSKVADIALKIATTHEAPLRSAATVSLLNQLYAVDILLYSFMTKVYDDNVKNLELTRTATAKLADAYKNL